VTPGVSSGVAPIFVEPSGQNRIWVVKGANDRLTPADVDAAAEVIRGADYLVLQLEIPLETVYYALTFARGLGVRTILNPAPGQPLDLARIGAADYVIPNETEAEALTGIAVSNVNDAQAAARKLLDGGVRRVVVTLGENGALCADGAGMHVVAPFAVNPVDTTGAGDAFIGSLAVFLAEGRAELDAVSRANLYAALSTTLPGTMKSFVARERFESEWAVRGASGL
jgi:ribokinase